MANTLNSRLLHFDTDFVKRKKELEKKYVTKKDKKRKDLESKIVDLRKELADLRMGKSGLVDQLTEKELQKKVSAWEVEVDSAIKKKYSKVEHYFNSLIS